ncbi:splicing factor U2af large subunit B isoform X2 [Capsicum annuum]|uniref:splicing factor U2af large subunit B isoform X2 n=1 Tax=Capsicum annuum TaxID=4072 RepID=UPI001FB06105|nr:splicing factor U2af large subunit B isoform X2 [Capsicum annuum]
MSSNVLKFMEEIMEDVTMECKLVKIVIPRPRPDGEPTPGVGKVYLDFEDVETSSRAQQGLNDRKYGSKFTVVVFYPENKFADRDYEG